jgi:hypothetical protein
MNQIKKPIAIAGALLGASLILANCVDNTIEETTVPSIQYFLDSEATGEKHNRLNLFAEDASFYVELSSPDPGLQASIPFNERVAMPDEIEFQAEEEDTYTVDLEIYLQDGTLYQEDELSWTYSTSLPPEPVVGFKSPATNDEHVLLMVAGNRGVETTELWIEGDLAAQETPDGKWRTIPDTGIIPLTIDNSDGLKTFKVKTRNIFGNISTEKTIGVIKKTGAPENCRVDIPSYSTADHKIKARLHADDENTVYYRVYGDSMNDRTFHAFYGQTDLTIELTPGEGQKTVTVQIKDMAENYCMKEKLEFTVTPEYNPGRVKIAGDPLWTDDPYIQVTPEYDALPDTEVEVFVHGGVQGPNTEVWLPMQKNIEVELTPYDGHRWVRVKYRVNGLERETAWTGIYLRPFIMIKGSSEPYDIVVSDIVGASSLSIRGCAETYDQISYQSSYSCSPVANEIFVDFHLKDGSTLTRSALL